jgi:outer membrane protein TolC
MRWTLAVLFTVQVSAAAEPAAPAPGAAETAAEPKRLSPGYSLKRCLDLAEQNYPKVHEARAKLEGKRAQQFQSWTQPYSDFTVTGGLALVPTVRGTPVFSPDSDVALSSDMGLAWNVGVEGAIPLWTFGKITNLWDATAAQVRVAQHEVTKEKNEVRLSVRRAYYGVQLARDALVLVRDAAKRIDKHLNSLAAKVEEGEGDEIELLKLRMHRAELEARESEAARQEAIALAGLRFLTGAGSALDVPDQPLKRNKHSLGPLARYLTAARLYRPEVNMARAGVLAREAQLRVERARYFPDLAVGLTARWAEAPGITDQRNPFTSDRANYLSYGAALALRYKIDFLPQFARVSQAASQLEEMRATERYALGGVGVEVETAFREAEDAARRLDAYSRAAGFAKQWLIQVQQGIDVGTYDDEDIVDPAREFALKRFSQMSATFDYNVALARLAQVTGWDAVAGEE